MKYANEVWDLIQQSYAPIGGFKTRGIERPEDLIYEVPFWKLAIKDNKIKALMLYKEKNGRKAVALATDGSEEGKNLAAEINKNEVNRSYMEISKGTLGQLFKQYEEKDIVKFLMTPDEVRKILKDEIKEVKHISYDKLPKDAQLALQKFPFLKDFGYLREIGAEQTFKVMVGKSGLQIHKK